MNKIEEIKDRYCSEVDSLNTQLEAWHSVFGTSQLGHARARLEAAEQKVESLQRQLAERTIQWNESEAYLHHQQLTRMREAIKTALPLICLDCYNQMPFNMNGDHGFSPHSRPCKAAELRKVLSLKETP